MSGPCEWPVQYGSCDTKAQQLLDSMDADDKAACERMATEFLWLWTGQAYGTCPVTVRPCLNQGIRPSTFFGYGPQSLWGSVAPYSCRSCLPASCSCAGSPQVGLAGPVAAVDLVVVDGQQFTAWQLDGRWLVRTDGLVWPRHQDLTANLMQPGSWGVTYRQGIDVPTGGQVAAGILASEFAKAWCGDTSCALPRRVQTVTRQGVTVAAVLDTFSDVEQGRTGLWMVYSWVASVVRPKRRSAVYNPDLMRTRR